MHTDEKEEFVTAAEPAIGWRNESLLSANHELTTLVIRSICEGLWKTLEDSSLRRLDFFDLFGIVITSELLISAVWISSITQTSLT
ncbi:hypothetical protein FQA47_013600, partial [Oryzias melastigma]